MADRSSAELFGMFFTLLAENPTPENKAIAAKIFPKRRNYDFDDYQMYCDNALRILGLPVKDDDDDDDDDGDNDDWIVPDERDK